MVWSENTQYPFYVFDNNGLLIFKIDDTGVYYLSPTGYILIASANNVPSINFYDYDLPGNSFASIYGTVDAFAPYGQLVFRVAGGTIKDTLVAISDIGIAFKNHYANIGVAFNNALGFLVTTPNFGDASAWTDLTPANGWANRGAPFPNFGYRTSATGDILFRGSLNSGTLADNTPISSALPVGSRPPKDVVVGAQGPGTCRVYIQASDGIPRIYGAIASNYGFDGSNFSLIA